VFRRALQPVNAVNFFRGRFVASCHV
jgi:hypothetical protein